jgi:hypothetical protein
MARGRQVILIEHYLKPSQPFYRLGDHNDPQCTEGQMEAERGQVTHPQTHGHSMVEPRFQATQV